MPDESYVQVAADGSGKKIHNRKITEPTVVDSAGAAQADTVTYNQVVTLADERGDYVLTDLIRAIDELTSVTIQLRDLVALAVS